MDGDNTPQHEDSKNLSGNLAFLSAGNNWEQVIYKPGEYVNMQISKILLRSSDSLGQLQGPGNFILYRNPGNYDADGLGRESGPNLDLNTYILIYKYMYPYILGLNIQE